MKDFKNKPIITFCSSCGKARKDDGTWIRYKSAKEVEALNIKASHGICDDCGFRIYPEFYGKIVKSRKNK